MPGRRHDRVRIDAGKVSEAHEVEAGDLFVPSGLRSLAFNILHISDPVHGAALEAGRFALSLEDRRHAPEKRWSHAFESVDADDRVEMTVDSRRHQRDDATPGADVELGGPRAERVPGYE